VIVDFADAEGLVLDAESHRYFWNGQHVGGVTEIIQGLGLVDPRWFSDYSRDRGTAVHAAMEYLVRGLLDWSTVDQRIVGYVRAGEAFLRDAGIKPTDMVLTEHLVFHEAHRYAGKLDLFALAFGESSVIDFKSGGLGCASIQTAAYEEALRVELGAVKPFRRMAVQLREDGTYRKEDFRASSDYAIWYSCCLIFNTFHLKKGNRYVE